jgi:hypothetical protein
MKTIEPKLSQIKKILTYEKANPLTLNLGFATVTKQVQYWFGVAEYFGCFHTLHIHSMIRHKGFSTLG